MRIKNIYILLSIGFVVSQCVNPLERDVGQPLNILVVEGFIDDDFGPHEIEVSLLSNFASIAEGGNKRPVDAEVRIFDDLGNSVALTRETFIREDLFNANPQGCAPAVTTLEITTNYMTPATFRGVVGRSYALEVILTNGEVYRSNLQQLPGSPELDSIFVDFATRPGEDDIMPVTGVDVFAVWQDNPEVDNFHFWDIDGTYKIETPNRTDGTLCCLYDPRDEVPAEKCWVVERNIPGTVRAFEDRLVSGTQAVERIGFVEDDGRRFASIEVLPDMQYHIEVHQYTVSAEAFEFLRNIEVLSEIDGEIFDPPPVGAKGNIINLSDPNEQVVGFFGVYGKRSRGTFVRRTQLGDTKQHTICGDCRRFANGQLEVPEPYQ